MAQFRRGLNGLFTSKTPGLETRVNLAQLPLRLYLFAAKWVIRFWLLWPRGGCFLGCARFRAVLLQQGQHLLVILFRATLLISFNHFSNPGLERLPDILQVRTADVKDLIRVDLGIVVGGQRELFVELPA